MNSYLFKVFTFEIEPQKLASTKLDIKSRNVKFIANRNGKKGENP